MVIGPKPLFNPTRWCGLGKHAKRALEGGGAYAHLPATHPSYRARVLLGVHLGLFAHGNVHHEPLDHLGVVLAP